MTAAVAEKPASSEDREVSGIPFPEKSGSFVAYARDQAREADPASGTSVSIRPEVLVRQYRAIKVAKVEEKSHTDRSGGKFRTMSVTFDAASLGVAGFNRDFGASCLADSKIAALLDWAHKSGTPVAVALETVRRYKNKSTGEVIPRTTGIMALRSDAEGKANANITADNCRNIIALVGVESPDGPMRQLLAGEAVSDVTEWGQLGSNRDGALPPDGWRRVTDPNSPAVSTITPVLAAVQTPAADPQPSAGGADIAEQVAAQVSDLVGKALSRLGIPVGDPDVNYTRPVPAGIRPGARAVEAKPWEPLNSDGRVNAASYLLTKWCTTYDRACDLVAVALSQPDAPALADGQVRSVIAALTNNLLVAADATQEAVTGHVNRASESHHRAAEWVRVMSDRFHPYPVAALTDQATSREWAMTVASEAGRAYRWAMTGVGEYLGVDPDLPAQD